MDAIRTEALTKHYKVGFWRPRPYLALENVSLRVGQGEVFGFLGPNGAGKTTTLKLLMQLIFPTSGRAEILGLPVGHPDVRRRIGYLPENPYFYDYLTAEELLQYFAGLFGYAPAERRARATRLLDAVQVGAERRLALRKLSKGNVQRVGIAQALVNDPEVVFLDEPMSGLDPIGRRDIRELILDLRSRGTTVFFSSHVLSDAETLCNRVAVVASGRLAAQGALSELLAFQIRGWELVVDRLSPDALETLQRGHALTVTPLGPGRYTLRAEAADTVAALTAALWAAGAEVTSLNAIRDSLEDFFVRQVAAARASRGLDEEARS